MKLINLFYILSFTISCSKVNCPEYTKMIADEQCNIVIESQPVNSVWFKLNGYDPITQKAKVCKTNNRWWNLYANEIEVGDTIIKRNGELNFNIHKRYTVISYKWKCYEKINSKICLTQQ